MTLNTFYRLLVLAALVGGLYLVYQVQRQREINAHQLDPSLGTTADALAHSLRAGTAAESALEHTEQRGPCTGTPTLQRQLDAQLDRLDHALFTLTGPGNRFLDRPYHVDRRLFHHLAATNGSDCTAVRRVTAQFLAHEGAALRTALVWRERQPSSHQADFGTALARVNEQVFARANPWRPLSGCLLAAPAARYWPQARGAALCPGSAAEPGDVPPDADVLRWTLLAWANQGQGNRVPLLGRATPQGDHLQLTLAPEMQRHAQPWAECYTGHTDTCRALGLDPTVWSEYYEQAPARSVAILQMDTRHGGIEVLASATTPCYRQDHDGPGHDSTCPTLPDEPAFHPDKLANRALHGEAMPGSLVKPFLALGLLQSDLGPHLRGAGKDAFLQDIQTSKSEHFMNRLFAKDQGWQDRGRITHVANVLRALDIGADCSPDRRQCGRIAPQPGLDWRMVGLRLLQEPRRDQNQVLVGWQAIRPRYTAQWAARCASKIWGQCAGGPAVDLLSELWGQGHALASPLGIAAAWSQLGAAANGEPFVPPHLVSRRIRAEQTENLVPTPVPPTLNRDDVKLLLQGMQLTHRRPGGTAHGACSRVFGAGTCRQLDQVAGKTGTPVFRHDRLSVTQRRQQCTDIKQQLSRTPAGPLKAKLTAEWAQCLFSPMKWYAALWKTEPGHTAPWRKVIVVLVERNWNRKTGLEEGAEDKGPNLAAEIAFRVIQDQMTTREP